MPSLQEQVAQAVREAATAEPGVIDLREDVLAAVAIRVCMAEAQQAVEAVHIYEGDSSAVYDEGFNDALGAVLAVLAALVEESHAS